MADPMITRSELAWLREAATAGFHAQPSTVLALLDLLDASPPPSPLQVAVTRRGYSPITLAEALGCSRGHVVRVLAGQRRLGPRLQRRALALGFEPDDFDTAPAGLVGNPQALVDGLPATTPPVVVVESVLRTLARALLALAPPSARLHPVPPYDYDDPLPWPDTPER
jgi:hypothetical protein